MKRLVGYFVVLLFCASCGKNDYFRSTGGIPPYGQAPMPNGMYGPTGYNMPPPGAGPGFVPNFRPQIPPGYPPQFYPFVPISNYFQATPGLQNYWGQFWGGWQAYAGQQGYNVYDFAPFWTDYCANQWGGGGNSQMFNYFNNQFYFWVTPGMQFAPQVNPSIFWQNFSGIPYNYGNGTCSVCN